MTLALLLPPLAAALLALALTPLAARWGLRMGAVDAPGPRKVHARAVPRTGGVAVVFAVMIVLALLRLREWPGIPALPEGLTLGVVFGVIPVFAASLYDDMRPLAPWPRLAAQVLGACIAIAFGVRLGDSIHAFGETFYLEGLAIPLTILWIVAITNAFNIVDGLDGLSAGLALISAASVSALAIVSANTSLALLPLLLVGALIGFLPFNLYPARIFLGDCGAASLGFCLACLALPSGLTLPASMAVVVPLLAMGVPLVETVLSIVRRFLAHGFGGVFKADAEHIHHRLGFDHRRAVFVLYGAAILLAGAGMASLLVTDANAAILLATLFAAAFIGVGRLGYDEFALLRSGVVLRFYDAPVLRLGFFRVFVDLGLVSFAWYGALVLKYDDLGLQAHGRTFVSSLALILPWSVIVFWAFRFYQRAWRFASIDDVVDSTMAAALCGLGAFVFSRFLLDVHASITLFLTFTVLLLLVVGTARSSFRVLAHFSERNRPAGKRIAIYGAGACGLVALRELRSNAALDLQVVGFIDDNPAKVGRRVAGCPVLGGIDEAGELVRKHRLVGVVVATGKLKSENLQTAVQTCSRLDVDLLRFSLDMQSMRLSDARLAELGSVVNI
jgi:UDP-GlcNAc:undecaprenyl-phosphate GlcNAc-1-phosphate transferase